MRIQSLVKTIIILLVAGGIAWFGYKRLFPASERMLFKTQKPEKRDIHKIVHAEGSLEAQGTSKLGPLITATVKKIYVKEGQKVTKDMLLADLENQNGGDLDVRRAKAQLEQAQATLTYITAVHEREKALHKTGELSQEAFEKSFENYQRTNADVNLFQAAYDKEVFLFDQIKVRAPHDGIISAINVKEGQTVSPVASPAIILFDIVQDLEKMLVTLYIDEGKVGDVNIGMTTEISVDTYPYRQPWIGKIESIGMSGQQHGQAATIAYKAEILIDNNESLLRPGMSVHAKTIIAEVTQALAVPGFVFQLNGKVLEAVAKSINYAYKPLDPAQKKALLKNSKTLWVVENKTFVERAVQIGVTDNAYFQILAGLQETEEIIADDMTASDELKKIAQQMAG